MYVYNRIDRSNAIPVQESTAGIELVFNILAEDTMSNIIAMSMTLPLLHDTNTTQMVNMPNIGSRSRMRNLGHAMFPASEKKRWYTQLDPGIDVAKLKKQTDNIAEIGILIFNASLVLQENFLLTTMRGDANANTILGNVYQFSCVSPVMMGYWFFSNTIFVVTKMQDDKLYTIPEARFRLKSMCKSRIPAVVLVRPGILCNQIVTPVLKRSVYYGVQLTVQTQSP